MFVNFWLFQCFCRALENINFSSNRPYASSVRSKNNRSVSDGYESRMNRGLNGPHSVLEISNF